MTMWKTGNTGIRSGGGMVDTIDLGSIALRCESSSLSPSTKKFQKSFKKIRILTLLSLSLSILINKRVI